MRSADTQLEMPHADQAVRKFRRRVLPDEQRLLERRLPFDLQFCRLEQPRERCKDLGLAQAITAAQDPPGLVFVVGDQSRSSPGCPLDGKCAITVPLCGQYARGCDLSVREGGGGG